MDIIMDPYMMKPGVAQMVMEYKNSLEDLKMNSKPLINMLTILAEEGLEYAHAIVQTVEQRLDEVDEKTRSQMFKLRETWHDVFPSSKLYQLDVKVNVIDPAWPIQPQMLPADMQQNLPQNNIHLNPLFIKHPTPKLTAEEHAKQILMKKHEELRLLTLKRMQIEEQRKVSALQALNNTIPSAVVAVPPNPTIPTAPIGRIAPAGVELVNHARRKDPRLAARQRLNTQPTPLVLSNPTSMPQVATVTMPLAKVDKVSKHTKDHEKTEKSPRKDPRLKEGSSSRSSSKSFKRSKSPHKSSTKSRSERRDERESSKPKSEKLSPIPKIKRSADSSDSPSKRRKDNSSSTKSNSRKVKKSSDSSKDSNAKPKSKHTSNVMDVDDNSEEAKPSDVTFKELKSSMKDRNYRNREKSLSPDDSDISKQISEVKSKTDVRNLSTIDSTINGSLSNQDIDLRQIPKIDLDIGNKKRKSDDGLDSTGKKSKVEKFDALFGNEDVDLRTLNIVEGVSTIPAPLSLSDNDNIDLSIAELSNPDGGWAKVKENSNVSPTKESFKNKLAVADQETDRLGRPFLYKSVSAEGKPRKKSRNFEDTDMRLKKAGHLDNEGLDDSIKIIMSQAADGLKSGQMNKDQYNTLLMQVLSLNEKQKLKAAKKRESIEVSKRKKYSNSSSGPPEFSDEDYSSSPRSDEDSDSSVIIENETESSVSYGDIDERIPSQPIGNIQSNSSMHVDNHPKKAPLLPRPDHLDSDFRMNPNMNGPDNYYMGDPRYPPAMRGHRPYGPRGWRGRGKGDEWRYPRPRGPHVGGNWRGPGMKNFENNPRFPTPNYGPRQGIVHLPNVMIPYNRETSPPLLGDPSSRDFSYPDKRLIEYVQQDTMKSILIDGKPKEIRFYGTTAITMMGFDDPREISFHPEQRRLYLDGESYVLRFNEDYINVMIDGQPHRMKFGAPTRELIIDNNWYECYFGGPPLQIMLDGKMKQLRLEGPPPQVAIGDQPRRDLVVGKINLIIDARNVQRLFLDAKPQLFEVDGHINTIRFVDSLQTILINEKPFKVEFGDIPIPIFLGKRKHYIRFTALPRSVIPGQVNITNMEGRKPSILHPDIYNNQIASKSSSVDQQLNADNENSQSGLLGGLDILASVMPSSMAPASQFSGYSIGETSKSLETNQTPAVPSNVTSLLQNLNVNDLFEKLVSSGIVKPASGPSPSLQVILPDPASVKEPSPSVPAAKLVDKSVSKNVSNLIKPVNLMKSETLRIPQPGLIAALYSGMQCGSCGVRFPPEHTVRYSQHLDWHFRQNKAEKDSQKRPHSRRWYYDITDWVQYEEIEDLEEREKSWFESQQQAAETESNEATAARLAQQQQEASSVPAGQAPQDLRCELCRDSFDQFYHEESEEWHLRKAVRHEDKNYHPLCLEEYKASLIETKEEEEEEETSADNTEASIQIDDVAMDKSSESEEMNVEVVNLETTVDDNANDKDNESVVEVLSECQSEVASQEDDDIPEVEVLEEDDDVVLKVDPVEQIVVDDEDTDDETEKAREERDREFDLSKIDFSKVKIKQEPIDPEDEPIITATEEVISAPADTTHTAVLSSIDGNVQLEPTVSVAPTIPAGGIKINITKPINQQAKEKEAQNNSDANSSAKDSSLLGDGDSEIKYSLKPSLQDVVLSKQASVKKGSELSGLCSIM